MSEVAIVLNPPPRPFGVRQYLYALREEAISQALADPGVAYRFEGHVPSEEQLRVGAAAWWKKVCEQGRRSPAEIALMVELAVVLTMEQGQREKGGLEKLRQPFSFPGDVMILASRTACEVRKDEAADRSERIFGGRVPIQPDRLRSCRREFWGNLQEDAERRRDHRDDRSWSVADELRVRIRTNLPLACRIALGCPILRGQDLPLRKRWAAAAHAGSFADEVRGRLNRAMNELLPEDVLGPGWRPKESPKNDSDGVGARETPDPERIELGLKLVGIPTRTMNTTPHDDRGEDPAGAEDADEEGTETLFAPVFEATFARELEEKEFVQVIIEKAGLRGKDVDLLRSLLDEEETNDIAARTGKRPGTVRIQVHRLRNKIKPFLPPS